MSEADVEVVRGLLAPFEAGDVIPIFREEAIADAMTEATAELFTSDFECVFNREDIGGSTYRGIEGLRCAWLDWLAPWDSYHAEVEKVIDLQDGRVLVLNRDHACPRGTDAEVSFQGATVWTVRHGKVGRLEFFFDRDQGLAAAGLAQAP